ncbi:YheC/YheD family protein [Aquibacillus salsiterrae]|uniref:YheC/YheD family protein n=1 Tax=Aquibacillus salsiterrae TaxID=2950439 RepID=A0A9X3WBI7_9BACI|nr:YheC/YheD family protein [Aquibacillus salsiterrae]MDC3416585.1 YheC/YheD family protein [Aquibacillus salsiterrae]
MTTIAMLHYRKNPEKVKKAFACAAVAKAEGIDFYYFTPGMVDFKQNIVYGKVYQKGTWVSKELPFPDVIYNAGPPLTEKQKKIHSRLRKTIPFLSNPVGSKLSVFYKIKKSNQFTEYLIPYKKVSSPNTVIDYLEEYGKVVVKPVTGHQGEGIHFIQKIEKNYLFDNQKQQEEISKQELEQRINDLLQKNKWIVQKYITSFTKAGMPFDIRLHVQKNSEGKWSIMVIYPRVSLGKSIASNLRKGARMSFFDDFLEQEYGDRALNMKKYIEVFALQFSDFFESLYPYSFDELGIDIGLDEEGKIWLYEVNWRPGTVSFEMDVARNIIGYGMFVAKTDKERK